jgi:hypothetical protein
MDDTLTGIGRALERAMEHAPGRRLPPEQWPPRFRHRCLACQDLGVEFYGVADPTHGGLYAGSHAPACLCSQCTAIRPCVHCDEGKRVLEAWTAPAKPGDRESRPGPWYGMDPDRIGRILSRPCGHDLLP